jgi:hypothetical protein
MLVIQICTLNLATTHKSQTIYNNISALDSSLDPPVAAASSAAGSPAVEKGDCRGNNHSPKPCLHSGRVPQSHTVFYCGVIAYSRGTTPHSDQRGASVGEISEAGSSRFWRPQRPSSARCWQLALYGGLPAVGPAHSTWSRRRMACGGHAATSAGSIWSVQKTNTCCQTWRICPAVWRAAKFSLSWICRKGICR